MPASSHLLLSTAADRWPPINDRGRLTTTADGWHRTAGARRWLPVADRLLRVVDD